MNRKVLASMLVIGAVGVIAAGSTFALFNDTETSDTNTFEAGALDLQIDWVETYNGEVVENQSFTDNPGSIFDIQDVKPGDQGQANVSLHVFDNPAFVNMTMEQTGAAENGCTEPESQVDDSCGEGEGELGEHLHFTIYDNDGNEIFNGTAEELDQQNIDLGLVDNSTTEWVRIEWHVPRETGNVIQTDSKHFRFDFSAVQARHNGQQEDVSPEQENVTPNLTEDVSPAEEEVENVTPERDVTPNVTEDVEGEEEVERNITQPEKEDDRDVTPDVTQPEQPEEEEPEDEKPRKTTPTVPQEEDDDDDDRRVVEEREVEQTVKNVIENTNVNQNTNVNTNQVDVTVEEDRATGGQDISINLDQDISPELRAQLTNQIEQAVQQDQTGGDVNVDVRQNQTQQQNQTQNQTGDNITVPDTNVTPNETEEPNETNVTPPDNDTNVTPPDNDTNVTPPDNDTDNETNVTPPDNDTNVTPPDNQTDNETNETLAAISYVAFCVEGENAADGNNTSAAQQGNEAANPCPEGEEELVRFEWQGNQFVPEGGDDMGVTLSNIEYKEDNEPIRVDWESEQDISTVVVRSAGENCSQAGDGSGTAESCGPPSGQQ